MNDILQAIGTVGFPIVAAIGCFWYMTKLNETHREEISEMRKAIENNTAAMTRLIDRIGGGDDGKG